jgi:hypothetical protein
MRGLNTIVIAYGIIEGMEKKPTSYIVAKFGCDAYTAQKWAKNNGVEFLGRMYFWSEEDIAKFAVRRKPGGSKPGNKRTKKGGDLQSMIGGA